MENMRQFLDSDGIRVMVKRKVAWQQRMFAAAAEDAAASASSTAGEASAGDVQGDTLGQLQVAAHAAKASGFEALLANAGALQKEGASELLEEFNRGVDCILAKLVARAAFLAAGRSGDTGLVTIVDSGPRPGQGTEWSPKQEVDEERARISWLEHLKLEAKHLQLKEREYKCLVFAREEYKGIAQACLNASKAIEELASSLKQLASPPSAVWEQEHNSWNTFGHVLGEELSD